MRGLRLGTCCVVLVTALVSTLLIINTAGANNGYPQPYQPNTPPHQTRQHTDWQQATHQPYSYSQAVIIPPTVLPYIPFDDEVTSVTIPAAPQNVIPPPVLHPQPAQHYRPRTTIPPSGQTTHLTRHNIHRQAPARSGAHHLSHARQRVLQAARRQLGVRYRWGGNNPRQGFDCSGFTKHAMRSSNISIPRTAAQQSQASRTISRHQLRPGDMIFFKTSGRHINHVGIYLGDGRFIHAASGGGKVTTDNLRKPYWQKRLHKYGTFFS